MFWDCVAGRASCERIIDSHFAQYLKGKKQINIKGWGARESDRKKPTRQSSRCKKALVVAGRHRPARVRRQNIRPATRTSSVLRVGNHFCDQGHCGVVTAVARHHEAYVVRLPI